MIRTPHSQDGREASLRALDIAAHIPDAGASSSEARTLLERIMATDPEISLPVAHRGGRRHTLRWAAGAVAVAVAGVVAVTQSMDGSEQALGSWSATPSPATGKSLATATERCRQQIANIPAPPGNPPAGAPMLPTAEEVAAARVIIAERRGEGILIAMGGDRNLDATCFMWLDGRTADVGALSRMSEVAAPADGILVGQTVGAVDGELFAIIGHVGSDVVGVTFITPDGRRVEATVTDGHVAAWWPGITVPVGGDVSADIRLRDGTVRQVAVTGPKMGWESHRVGRR